MPGWRCARAERRAAEHGSALPCVGPSGVRGVVWMAVTHQVEPGHARLAVCVTRNGGQPSMARLYRVGASGVRLAVWMAVTRQVEPGHARLAVCVSRNGGQPSMARLYRVWARRVCVGR